MGSSGGRRAPGMLSRVPRSACILICALALAGCNPDGQALSPAQPRGATVAFDSLDGLPPGQFQKLVQNLNEEAQARRLAVISREQSSAYRVRGYLAAKVTKHQTTVSWVWDVFDQDEHRALRISGEETAKVRPRGAWPAADDGTRGRLARSSMDQLAAFLTSPAVAPATSPPTEDPQLAIADSQDSSPEAAGIFRLFRPQADPVPTVAAEAAIDAEPIPLPPRRPRTATLT